MNEQATLWDTAEPRLRDYDWVVVNSSGGKDSQTMLGCLVALADAEGYLRSHLVVAHADLGRAEWAGTRELAERQAKHYGLRFEAIARPQGWLLDHITKRGRWPSSVNRYCTSDHKRGQIQKILTQLDREVRRSKSQHVRILNCMGMRAQESPARAKLVSFQPRQLGSTQHRDVDRWLPIHDWTEAQVWATIKASGVPHHYAYDLGMPRLSCVFCIFAPRPALILAGQHNRELLDEYVAAERQMGHTFRQGFTIESVRDAIEAGETTGAMNGDWNM